MMRSRAAARLAVALLCATTLTACRDNGLPDRNLPLDEARHRELRYPVYESSRAVAPVALGGRHWVPAAPAESVPARMLVQVGNAEGTLLFARRGEAAPYARLYAPVGTDRWLPYVRIN